MTYKCTFCDEREADRECYFCHDPMCIECSDQCPDCRTDICPGCTHVDDGVVYCPDCPEEREEEQWGLTEQEIMEEMIADEFVYPFEEGGFDVYHTN